MPRILVTSPQQLNRQLRNTQAQLMTDAEWRVFYNSANNTLQNLDQLKQYIQTYAQIEYKFGTTHRLYVRYKLATTPTNQVLYLSMKIQGGGYAFGSITTP